MMVGGWNFAMNLMRTTLRPAEFGSVLRMKLRTKWSSFARDPVA